MRTWDNVRRDWVMVPYKGIDRKLKLYQYLKALSDCMPDGRIKISDPKVDHKPALKDAYIRGGLEEMHAEAARIIDADYIAKCQVYWNKLTEDLLYKLSQYFGREDITMFRIEILLNIDKSEFVSKYNLKVRDWELIEEVLQRTGLNFEENDTQEI